MQVLAIGEDNLIEVGTADKPLRYAADDELVAEATVTAQLKTEEFESVGSPVDIEPTDDDGIYQGTLSGVGLTHDAYYWLEITITGTAGGFRRIKCQARYHQEQP